MRPLCVFKCSGMYCWSLVRKETGGTGIVLGELMATTKEYHDYVMECLNKAGDVTSRKMMGEYCLYCNGKLFGDICDNRLLVKQTETSKKLLADCPLEYPYEGSKNLMFLVTEFENPDLMKELLEGMYRDLR